MIIFLYSFLSFLLILVSSIVYFGIFQVLNDYFSAFVSFLSSYSCIFYRLLWYLQVLNDYFSVFVSFLSSHSCIFYRLLCLVSSGFE